MELVSCTETFGQGTGSETAKHLEELVEYAYDMYSKKKGFNTFRSRGSSLGETSYNMLVKGGNRNLLTAAESKDEWLESAESDPEVIEYNLVPMYNLVDKTTHHARWLELQQRWFERMNTKAVDKGSTSSSLDKNLQSITTQVNIV